MDNKQIIGRLNFALEANDIGIMRDVLYDVDEETDLVECSIEHDSKWKLEQEILELLECEEL